MHDDAEERRKFEDLVSKMIGKVDVSDGKVSPFLY